MKQRHTHHHRSRTSTKKQTKLERFFSSTFFIILGIISILAGFYSVLFSSESLNIVYKLILLFFTPSNIVTLDETTGSGLVALLIYFLPAGFALILASLYSIKYPSVTFPVAIIASLYLIIIQTILLVYNPFLGGCFYPNFLSAALFLICTTSLIIVTALNNHKIVILLNSSIFFYISIVLYGGLYSTRFHFLFSLVILLTIVVTWIGVKINKSKIHLVNTVFALGFLSLFWFRKFVVNAKAEFLPVFFIFGILFYLLFYAIVLYTSHSKENPIPKWMQLLISWANLSVFVGTTGYVLFKYFAFGYLPALVILLLLFNILGLYLIKRNNSPAWQLPHYFAIIGLASLVLPLLLHQNMILLFTATLSVLMLAYYKKFKEISAMWISLIAMSGMVLVYIASWIRIYLPAIIADTLPANEITIHGIVSGLAVIGALLATSYLLKDYELPLPKKMFGKRKHYRLVRTFLLVALFLTLGWLGFITVGQLTATRDFLLVGWFIAGALFFIAMINFYAGHQSAFKKPVLYAAFGFAFFYPIMVHWSMEDYRIGVIHSSDIHWNVLLIHYLALGLLIQLGRLVIKRIHRHNVKNTPLRDGLRLVTILFLIFILCTEYDNLSVFLSAIENNALSQTSVGPDLLTANKYLPYSVIIWIVTVGVFFRAVMRRKRFLRDMAIMVFVAVMIKIFAFDFGVLSQGARSAVFLILGIFLLLFAIIYPRVLKGLPVLPELRRTHEGTNARRGEGATEERRGEGANARLNE